MMNHTMRASMAVGRSRARPLVWAAVLVLAAAAPFAPGVAAQVYVQDSPTAAELIEAAEDRLRRDEVNEAVPLVQRVLDDYGRRLLERSEGVYTEARRVAEAMLHEDDRLLRAYRRAQGPAADRLLDDARRNRAALGRVVERYALTDAGLAAGMRLAGLGLAGGQAEEAAILLSNMEGHPGLAADGETAELRHRLTAAAGLLMGDQERYESARGALEERSAGESLEWLDRFADSLTRRSAAPERSPLGELPRAAPPADPPTPLWSLPIGGAEQFLIENYHVDRDQIDTTARDGRYLNAIPTLGESLLYVNDGATIYGVEPSSGMTIWERTLLDPDDSQQPFGRQISRWLPRGLDLNAVSASEGRVVAIAGFDAMVTIYQSYRSDPVSVLATMDADDGSLLWAKRPVEVDENLDGAFWYGRPIISQGRLYATARRRQRTQFQDGYLVAMELSSGRMIWRRHLASAALTDRQAVPGLGHMHLEGGHIYVDSRLGTIGKVSASDGSVAWLAAFPLNESQRQPSGHRPWQASAPAFVGAGVVVLDDWAGRVRILDPRTGEQRDAIPAERWGSPLYLVRTGGDVLAVGSRVGLYDGETLEEKWSRESDGPQRGRASVTPDRLFLPANGALAVIDLADGRELSRMPIETPGNVLALDGQVVIAGRESLHSISSWAVASEQLRRRIERNPEDPRPLMALAWLAFRGEKPEELIDTLDGAIDLVAPGAGRGEFRPQLFEQVLTMARDDRRVDEQTRRRLFDRLAAVTGSTDDEVTYRLELAKFHESADRFEDAVEQYQAILAEPEYRQRLYRHDAGSRQAGLEAQRRLQVLLSRHGREFYEAHEAYAAQRLSELRQRSDPEALVELAEAYPLASGTIEALRLAAERLAERDRPREAIALLQRAARVADDGEELGLLWGRQVELYLDAEQVHRARRALRSLIGSHPRVEPIRDGEPVEASAWLEELEEHPATGGLRAGLELPFSGEPQVLRGKLLLPTHQDPDALPTGHVLLRIDGEVEMRSVADMSTVWRAPVERGDVQVLSMDRHRVWLWSAEGSELRLLDAQTGEQRWRVAGIMGRLGAMDVPEARSDPEAEFRRMVGRGAGRAEARRALRAVAPQRPGEDEPELLPVISDEVAAVADRSGRVIAFDANDGSVLWQAATDVALTSQLLADGRHIVLAGADPDAAPLLAVYDARAGRELHRLTNPQGQEVLWAGINDRGSLVHVSRDQVEAFDLNSGRSLWSARPGTRLAREAAALGANRLLVSSDGGDKLWIDLANGEVVNRVIIRGAVQQPGVLSDAGAWFIVGEDRAIAADGDGEVLWRDSISDATRFVARTLTDRYLLLLSRPVDGDRFTDPRTRRLYVLDRADGTLRLDHKLVAPEHLEEMAVMDGKLLISGSDLTAVLSGSQ